MANFTDINNINPNRLNFLKRPLLPQEGEMNGNPFNDDKIDTILLHWSAIDGHESTLETLVNKNLAYHFLINSEGNIYQLLELKKRGWHAGTSYGPGGVGTNDHSIGIAFTTSSVDVEDSEGASCNELCTDSAFYGACRDLIMDILSNENEDPDNRFDIKHITGHHMVSPGRRVDPHYFPFNELIKDVSSVKQLRFWATGDGPRNGNGDPATDNPFEGAIRDNETDEPYLLDDDSGRMDLRYDNISDAVQAALNEQNLTPNDKDVDDLSGG